MQIEPINILRTSDLQRGRLASFNLNRTQSLLDNVQEQISTGRRLNRPSDDAADATVAQQLRKTIERRDGYLSNLDHADRQLIDIDSALSEVTDLLRDVRTTALANLNDGVSDAERKGAADIVGALRRQLFNLANTQSGGISVFAGDVGVDGRDAYTQTNDGVRFNGNARELVTTIGDDAVSFQLSGTKVFGGVSSRVMGSDVRPSISTSTRLGDLDGSRGLGVDRGTFRLSNGGTFVEVDLTQADTVGDVVNQINATGIGVTASIVNGNAIQIAGANVRIEEASGTTAADLGILQPIAPTVVGTTVQPRVTKFTNLADLNNGAGIDTTGLVIRTPTGDTALPLAGVTTVGEFVEQLNNLATPIRAEIATDGTGILIRNDIQGSRFSIYNAAGGTTASDLGVESFTDAAQLTDLNGGRGVRLDPNDPDIRLTDTNGVGFSIDLDPQATMADVVQSINDASAAAGANITATFSTDAAAGYGLQITNLSAITDLGQSNAVFDLGFPGTAAGAGVTQFNDVHQLTSEGVFGHIDNLITALEDGDMAAAERAMSRIEGDETQVIAQRGDLGARMQEIQTRRDRLEEEDLQTREMLSNLEDVDFAAAVLEYQSLQTTINAQLQLTSQLNRATLFDFLG